MPKILTPLRCFRRRVGRGVGAILLGGLAVAVVGCSAPPSNGSVTSATASAVAFEPTATIQDVMLSMVDPSADEIWEAVATVVTPEGIEERRPRTDEEWMVLHADAVRLVEATNLLLMERPVAKNGTKSENPGIELEPEEIQVLIDRDRETWQELVHGLYETGKVMLDAVEARDADKLFDNGGPLDQACENCHRQYWYPESASPAGGADTVGQGSVPAGDSAAVVGDAGGTIEGHVLLRGKSPGNRVVRMGMDPKCAAAWAGEPAVEEVVAVNGEGDLANVLVELEGPFPPSPVPEEPVVIDQEKCFFVPRVAAARVGQTLELRNSDPLGHNVHGTSLSNRFNVSQPTAGALTPVSLHAESAAQGVLEIKCDVHRWMKAFVGVVDHPYFSVTDRAGEFSIHGVPPGEHTISAWHELFGALEQQVTVEAGETATVAFEYPADPS